MTPHRAQGVTGWFDVNENDVNHMLGPQQSPEPSPAENPAEIS